jgi:hypothetical protein
VCNENGNCHCNAGWRCPDCLEAYDGLGGSIDSGFNCEALATTTATTITGEATTEAATTPKATTSGGTTATGAPTTPGATTTTQTPTITANCGNGIVEDGEQCDCATQQVTEEFNSKLYLVTQ